MNVICLQEVAFYKLIDQVIEHVQRNQQTEVPQWLSGEQAMAMLHITSKTTLQKLRDTGKIRFSQPEKKIILYDRDSILKFLNKHASDNF